MKRAPMIEPGLHETFGPDGFDPWRKLGYRSSHRHQFSAWDSRDEYLKDLSNDIRGFMVIDLEGAHMFNGGGKKLTVSVELGT